MTAPDPISAAATNGLSGYIDNAERAGTERRRFVSRGTGVQAERASSGKVLEVTVYEQGGGTFVIDQAIQPASTQRIA